jgi:hypothetical protein
MAEFVRSLSRHSLPLFAFTLAYTAIALNLGPAWMFVAWFFNGCAYIIYLALK